MLSGEYATPSPVTPTLLANSTSRWSSPTLRVEKYLTPAPLSTAGVGFVGADVWRTLMHRLPAERSTVDSDTGAAVTMGVVPK